MISREKTTVAVLRQKLGLSVEEFGQLIGKSLSTVTKLEVGLLKLSVETAIKISNETGVDVEWLMAGEPKEDPLSTDEESNRKEPYSKELFEQIQAFKKSGTRIGFGNKPARRFITAVNVTSDWFSVYNAAVEADATEGDGVKAQHIAYLMGEFLAGLVERFGKDDEAFLRLNAGARIIDADGRDWVFEQRELMGEPQDGITLVNHAKRPTKR
jgi:transcriptional regulator with XRE-family HTH domain